MHPDNLLYATPIQSPWGTFTFAFQRLGTILLAVGDPHALRLEDGTLMQAAMVIGSEAMDPDEIDWKLRSFDLRRLHPVTPSLPDESSRFKTRFWRWLQQWAQSRPPELVTGLGVAHHNAYARIRNVYDVFRDEPGASSLIASTRWVHARALAATEWLLTHEDAVVREWASLHYVPYLGAPLRADQELE